jgi:tRNA dimethylallyltransferase
MPKNLVVILGPTASGKTQMAVRLALDLKGEVISADSRQVYKKMDLGTGKDLDQYSVGGRKVQYHLIDTVDPRHEFNVFEFQQAFYRIFSELSARRVTPILVGGTGLYLESILLGYSMPGAPPDGALREKLRRLSMTQLREELLRLKPRLHNRTDLEDPERLIRAIEIETARLKKTETETSRPNVDAVVFGLKWERAALRARITQRLKERLSAGMIEEVANLHREGISWERLESFGLEYRYIAQYLQGKLSLNAMTEKLNTAIHQFAKRQETWFRRMEKKGVCIIWVSPQEYDVVKETVLRFLQ